LTQSHKRYVNSDGIDITRIVLLHRKYHGKVIRMPKDSKDKTKAQHYEWEIRRKMLKDQTPYKGSQMEKDHKATGEKGKGDKK
jgi:hypothetical protein